jgi:tetratricopeptide (TPR) repeat protein
MDPFPAQSEQKFISYAREDSEFALKLATDLRRAGANIWLDRLDIPVGANWPEAVEKALDSCGHFLVILSPASVGSFNVNAEMNFALDEGKRIFPVLREECKLPFRIRTVQYADFTGDYQNGLLKLFKALGVELAREAADPLPLQRIPAVEEMQPTSNSNSLESAPAPVSRSPEMMAERACFDHGKVEIPAVTLIEDRRRAVSHSAPDLQPSEMTRGRLAPPLRVFLSYSHRDEELCERFLVHLRQLHREGLIESWHDRRIAPGSGWGGEIDDALNSADIVILLVSPDFLASDYCNDVELTRALERSQKGEARLVMVILRPCDWQTSRFAVFQALPKEGKPVVDWNTLDHGLDNAVKGLRRLILELCRPAPVGAQALREAGHRQPWRWVGAVALAVLTIALSMLWSAGQRHLKQGTDLLNEGRYADARPALERAKSLNPLSTMARCGLKAIELDSNHADEQRLNEAVREFPTCAYLKVLRGDHRYLRGDLPGALADYEGAVQREPRVAEAYFSMGRILERQDKPDSALAEYQLAVKFSPGTARYYYNLAELYIRGKDYENAVEQYEPISRYPLAALELANVYRLQDKLEEARGREEHAIRWLKDRAVQAAEQENLWVFEVSPIAQTRLVSAAEKQCYADLELAVTRFLQEDEEHAAKALPLVFEKCKLRRLELKGILSWELHKLGTEAPKKIRERSDEFTKRFLADSAPALREGESQRGQ